jgi:hypothetical protein
MDETPEHDRRRAVEPTDYRRRREERREDFRDLRDKILLIFGLSGVFAMAVVSVLIEIKNPSIALAVTTLFGGFAASPGVLRLDERRRDRNGEDR